MGIKLVKVSSQRGNLLKITTKNVSIFYSEVLVVNIQNMKFFHFLIMRKSLVVRISTIRGDVSKK